MKRRPVRVHISIRHLALLACVLLLSACSPRRSYEAALMLTDIGAGAGPSSLKDRTAIPKRTAVTYSVAGRIRRADLYLPGDGTVNAGIVLVPGIVPLANEDPRLVAFADTLARSHFAVLAPAIPDFRELRVEPRDARLVADAFVYLHGQPKLAPGGRAGIGALSYAVGLAVLAALEPDARTDVRFILGIGGYYDLRQVITYMTTGYMQRDGEWHYLKPDEYGKLVFAMGSLPHLRDARDRAVLHTMVERKLADPNADIAVLAPALGVEGRAVYALLMNSDPARTPALIQALPAEIRADIDALTLTNKSLNELKARLLLVHGIDDDIVPYTQSVELARAVRPKNAKLFLIHHILTHVEISEQPFLSRRFWTEDIPDFWRLYRALYALLGEASE